MTAILTLRDLANHLRAYAIQHQVPHAVIRSTCPRPWVADITGERTFMKGTVEYIHANSDGSRGVTISFVLWCGRRYDIFDPANSRRYRCSVNAEGKIVDEAMA